MFYQCLLDCFSIVVVHTYVMLQAYVNEASASHSEAAALQAAQAEAATALLAAKGALAARHEDARRASESAAAAKQLIEHPPEPLALEATSMSDTDVVKRLTLDQLLDYTPADTKVPPPCHQGRRAVHHSAAMQIANRLINIAMLLSVLTPRVRRSCTYQKVSYATLCCRHSTITRDIRLQHAGDDIRGVAGSRGVA